MWVDDSKHRGLVVNEIMGQKKLEGTNPAPLPTPTPTPPPPPPIQPSDTLLPLNMIGLSHRDHILLLSLFKVREARWPNKDGAPS